VALAGSVRPIEFVVPAVYFGSAASCGTVIVAVVATVP
jgi:hypothetical protein